MSGVGPIPSDLLGQEPTLGAEQYHGNRVGCGLRLADAGKLGLDGFEDGLGLHDHAGASAVRVVIDDPVLVLGVVPDVVEVDVDQTPVPGALYYAFAERSVKHGGEEGKDVKVHGEGRRLLVSRVALEQGEGVGQDRRDGVQALPDGLRAAGQVDYQA